MNDTTNTTAGVTGTPMSEGELMLLEAQEAAKLAAEKGQLPSQQVAGGAMSPMEQMYQTRYPNLAIVPGSLVQEKDHPKWANKVRVKVECGVCMRQADGQMGPRCTTVVERATSDLHTFIGCEPCKKVVRKLNQAAKVTAAYGQK